MMSMKQAIFLLLARHLNFNTNPISVASAFGSVSPKYPSAHRHVQLLSRSYTNGSFASPTNPVLLLAKPKKAGSTVDNYQTVSVNCSKCQQRLFRYKKKNGTKSNLVKCYIERISEDSAGVLALAASKQNASPSKATELNTKSYDNSKSNKKRNQKGKQKMDSNDPTIETENKKETASLVPEKLDPSYSWECPNCHTQFARSSMIHGRPALKMVGGKIRMTKK